MPFLEVRGERIAAPVDIELCPERAQGIVGLVQVQVAPPLAADQGILRMLAKSSMSSQETQSVTAPFLLQGAVYALEQGGLLLHDANLLYCNGSFATAVVVATFAREEIGRWQILLKLRREVLGGKQLSFTEVRDCCRGHSVKHRAGWLTVSSQERTEPAAIVNAIQTMNNVVQGSGEWQAAKAEYDRLVAQLKQSVPDDRHLKRMSALYVDPISDTEWNRPTKKITREFAMYFLLSVSNEYSFEQTGYTDLAIVSTKDPELAEALKNWGDRPTMPAQEIPMSPTAISG